MLGSLTRACGAKGYDLIVSFQEQSSNWHAEFEDSKKADGIILLGYGDYVEYSTRLDQLVAQGTHFVRWGAVQPGQPGISIGCDNQQGGADLTRHLLDQGCRRIGFLGNASDHYPEFLQRHRGYTEALASVGIGADPALQVDALTTERSGYEAARTLLAKTRDFDGLFCASDLIAIGAMRALQEQSIAIPAQVAIAGFDDIPGASFTNPSLTTVQQNTKAAAMLLVDTLLALIHDEPVESRMIAAPVVIRQSTLR
jgi:DNA-binding LacI/PurR family transcriptional regulator